MGSLAEGQAGGIVIIISIYIGRQVAQVGLIGDGVCRSASLVGGGEQIVAEGHAQLRGVGAPVHGGLIPDGEGGRGGDDGGEGVAAGEGAAAEGDEAIGLLDVNAGQGGAAVESVVADAGDAAADGHARQVIVPRGVAAVVVAHGTAAADGQGGVLSVLLAQ